MTDSPGPGDGSHEVTSPARAGDVDTGGDVYDRFAARSDFVELRRRYRRFAFPATIAFMVWYVTYVICNNWARGFMGIKVIGNINIAIIFGLLQFLTTFGIAVFYASHANKALDPLATKLQNDFDREMGR